MDTVYDRQDNAATAILEAASEDRKALRDMPPGELIPWASKDDRDIKEKELGEILRECRAFWEADHAKLAEDRKRFASNTPVEYDSSLLVDDEGEALTPVIQLPVEHAIIRTIHAQVKSSLLGEPPLVYVKPGRPDSADQAERVQGWLADWCEDRRVRYEAEVSRAAKEAALAGWCYWHIPYRVTRRYSIKRVGLLTPDVPDGGERTAPTLRSGWYVDEHLALETLKREDVLLYPPEESDTQAAAMLYHRYRLTRAELDAGRRPFIDVEGEVHPPIYDIDEDDWDAIFPSTEPSIKPSEGAENGTVDVDALYPAVEVEAWDVYAWWDWSGTGEALPVKFTFLSESELIIAATPAPLGDVRPFVPMHLESEDVEARWISVPDLIRQLVFEINKYETQSATYGDFAYLMASTAFGPQESGLARKAWIGRYNEVRGDPRAITFPSIPPEPANLDKVLHAWQQIRTLVGIGEPQMGTGFSVQKTATEAADVQTNANILLDNAITELGECITDAMGIVGRQVALYGGEVMQYTREEYDPLTGMPINREKVAYAADFTDTLVYTPSGTKSGANANSRAQKVLAWINLLMGNQAFANFVLADASRARNLLGVAGEAMGMDNLERYVGPELPPGSMMPMPAIPMMGMPTTEEEGNGEDEDLPEDEAAPQPEGPPDPAQMMAALQAMGGANG